MDSLIYLDNAATTAVKPEVFEQMMPYFMDTYSNPASVYSFAGKAKKAVDDAREQIANALNAKTPAEVYFTGGGSEADNWAIKMTAEAYQNKGKHIITTKIEHHAVLHTTAWLERKGFEVTYLDVDEDGLISLDELEKAIRPDTILISVMFANNEIGTMEPIKEIGAIAKKHDILYGKFFAKKAGFISKKWLPVFANYRRDGYDFDALFEDEKAPIKHKNIMKQLYPEAADTQIRKILK